MITRIEKGNWNDPKAELKHKFEVLSDNEQIFEKGMKEEIFGKLQINLGKTNDEWRRIIAML
jgi:uncharacterized protein YjbJ (UPF0337 family)